MIVKIKHIGDEENTDISVLDVMYAEALKNGVLRLWSSDGDYCDCTNIKHREYDYVEPFIVTASEIVKFLYSFQNYDIEACVKWCNG